MVSANILVVLGLVSFLWTSNSRDIDTPAILNNNSVEQDSISSRPLDQLSSADIAVNLARLGRFEEVYWLAEQAAEVEYLAELQQSSDTIAEKPQVVNSTIRTRKDIIQYTTVGGDTVSDLASRFGVSSDSIRWSNNLSSNSLNADQEISIPPSGLDGIVYEVEEGDSVEDLARTYQISRSSLVAFNDVVDGELPVGEQIFLQDAQQPVVQQAVATLATADTRPSLTVNGAVQPGYTPVFGANGYVFGHCTYYIATKTGAPNGLGNANTWDDRAESFGYTKSKTPVAGAIAQRDWGSFYGHLAYVEAVSADGSMIKYSDMNGIGGWNNNYFSDWVPATEFGWYLY